MIIKINKYKFIELCTKTSMYDKIPKNALQKKGVVQVC